MPAMSTIGLAPVLPPDARVAKTAREYVVSLPVAGFARQELEVEIDNHVLTIRGDQSQTPSDSGTFKLHQRIEESLLLPPDVDGEGVTAVYKHQQLEIHAPRISVRGGVRRIPITRPSGFNFDASGV